MRKRGEEGYWLPPHDWVPPDHPRWRWALIAVLIVVGILMLTTSWPVSMVLYVVAVLLMR